MAKTVINTVSGEQEPKKKPIISTDNPFADLVYSRDILLTGEPQALGRYGVGESKFDVDIKERDINLLAERRAAAQPWHN